MQQYGEKNATMQKANLRENPFISEEFSVIQIPKERAYFISIYYVAFEFSV